MSPSRLSRLRERLLSSVGELTRPRLMRLVAKEAARSKRRVDELSGRYPSAGPRELAQRLIDDKKHLAGMVGGISGVFGLVSVPADLAVTSWLELSLLVDVATVFKVNLKTESARREVLELYGYAHGVSPLSRSSPKVFGKVAGKALEKGGLKTLGKAVPVASAPLSAYLNSRHLQRVGEAAMRHYEGWKKAHQKASGP